MFQFPPDQFCNDCVWVERSVSNWVTEMSVRLLGSAHVFTRKDKLVKFLHLGSVVFCSFPSCWEFSSPTFFTRGLASGTLKPHDTHTHTRASVYIHISPSISLLCLSIFVFFSQFLPLCLSLSLFSVQLVNPSSLYRTTSFDTQQKPVPQLQHWQDEAKLPQKLCGSTWAYASLSCTPCILLHECDATWAGPLWIKFAMCTLASQTVWLIAIQAGRLL